MVLPQYGLQSKRPRSGGLPARDSVLWLSLALNALLLLSVFFLPALLPTTSFHGTSALATQGHDQVWHGGHPADVHAGSCWCGAEDHYCMCTPNLVIDLVIVTGKSPQHPEHFWLVRRSDTNQLAVMGGFVETNESVEQAVHRELQEEMGIHLQAAPALFGVYSDPRRDNRRRTVSAAFAVFIGDDVHPHAGDDAKEVKKIPLDDVEKHSFFSDHRTILLDYRRHIRGEAPQTSTEGDIAPDLMHSTCAQSSPSV